MLTDHLNNDGQGRQWGERVTHAAADSSGTAARDLADRQERDARRDSARFTRLHWLMLANAARAAARASKLLWLAGRARDEENATATALAADAVRTAMHMADLDMALAEQAMPTGASSVGPIRSALMVAPDRILRALPT